MGNCIDVFDKEGNLIGESTHGMMCGFYCDLIVQKYNPTYDRYTIYEDINEQLKPVYDHGAEEDQLILLVFLNDESSFDENDIPIFHKAIEKLEEGNRIHETIKKHLHAYLAVLEKYKFMRLKYTGSFGSITVSKNSN